MSAQENVWSSLFFFFFKPFLRGVFFFFFFFFYLFWISCGTFFVDRDTRRFTSDMRYIYRVIRRFNLKVNGLFADLYLTSFFFLSFSYCFFFFFTFSSIVFKVSKSTESKGTPSVKQWQDKKKRRGLVVCVAQERSVPQCVASLSSEAEQMDGTWTVLAFFSLFFFPDELSFP